MSEPGTWGDLWTFASLQIGTVDRYDSSHPQYITGTCVFQPQITAVEKKKGRQDVLSWPSINWVLKAPRAEPTSFRSSRKLCPEYKSIRMHTASIHVRLQCSLWLLYQIGGHISIPVAGAFGARVMDMTNGCW